jgi:hypothetical protein
LNPPFHPDPGDFYMVTAIEKQTRPANCPGQIAETTHVCPYCHNASLTYLLWFYILAMIISFREELSTELVILSFQDNEQAFARETKPLFSDQEIDNILEFKDLTVLNVAEVPHWNMMFYNSRRISYPRRRPATVTASQFS